VVSTFSSSDVSLSYSICSPSINTDFNVVARDYILTFMLHYFPDDEKLVTPIHGLTNKTDVSNFLNELKNDNWRSKFSTVEALGNMAFCAPK
jgi:hypothetical protein